MRRLVLLPALLAFLVGAVPALAWTWPVDGSVLQPFALAGDPYAAGQHRGIDVAATEGAPVRAPAAGMVSFAGAVPAGGRSVTILTSDGYAVTLLHLGTVLVAEGDPVGEGAPVGIAGWSGEAEHAVPSLHLGIRVAAETAGYLDPVLLLPPQAPGEPLPEEESVPPGPTPTSEAEGGEPVAPAGEGATLPPPPEAGRPALAAEAEIVQLEAVAGADASPLEPLAVAPLEVATPPEATALPEQAAEPSERASEARPSDAETPSASLSAVAGTLVQTLPPARASSPVGQPEADDEAGRLASRGRSGVRPNQLRALDRRTPGPATRPAPTRRRVRSIAGEPTSTFHQGVEQDGGGRAAARAPAARGGGWAWRALAAVAAATLVAALVAGRRGRGGPARRVDAASPLVPSACERRNTDGGVSPPAALPPARRSLHPRASERRRRLDRGGPGGPTTRPVPGLRRGRASV